MTLLSVDPDDLEDAVTDIRTSVTNLTTSLATLNAELRVLSTQWTGAASEAFQRSHRAWDQDMDAMVEKLTTIADLLYKAAVRYAETEGDVVERCS